MQAPLGTVRACSHTSSLQENSFYGHFCLGDGGQCKNFRLVQCMFKFFIFFSSHLF